MTINEIIDNVNERIDLMQRLYGDCQDPTMYRIYCTRMEDLEWILWMLESVGQKKFPLPWDRSYAGRRVLKLKATDRAEALAAIDMVKEQVLKDATDEPINEAVFVTNEGCAWMRDPHWQDAR